MIGTVAIPGKDQQLTYNSVSIEGEQYDTLLSFSILQELINLTGDNAEIVYCFPNEFHFCTFDATFIVDGCTIKPKIRSSEEAQKEFDEATKNGFRAILGENIGNGLNPFHLGNLPSGKIVQVLLKVSFLADINDNSYFFKFPLAVRYQKGVATTTYSDIPDSFFFSLKIKTTKEIADIIASEEGDIIIKDPHNATFETKTFPEKDSFVIETKIKDEDKNIAVYSDGYIAASINYSFRGDEIINSEFYFIVDCSGSMLGARIKNAK